LNRLCHSNTRFLHSLFTISRYRQSYRFPSTVTNLHTELDVHPLLQILVTTVYRGHAPLPLLLGSVARVNPSWSMPKRALVHEFAWLNTPSDTMRPFRELNCRTMHIPQ
jgi:hypothetical protein